MSGDPLRYVDPRGLFGFGLFAGGGAEMGIGPLGMGFNVGAGYGIFGGGKEGPNIGGFLSKSFFPSASSDKQWAAGASYGGGGGYFFTNAQSPDQLCGISHQFNLNIAVGSFALSWDDHGTFVVTGTIGPKLPFSIGSASYYPSVTYKPF